MNACYGKHFTSQLLHFETGEPTKVTAVQGLAVPIILRLLFIENIVALNRRKQLS